MCHVLFHPLAMGGVAIIGICITWVAGEGLPDRAEVYQSVDGHTHTVQGCSCWISFIRNVLPAIILRWPGLATFYLAEFSGAHPITTTRTWKANLFV